MANSPLKRQKALVARLVAMGQNYLDRSPYFAEYAKIPEATELLNDNRLFA